MENSTKCIDDIQEKANTANTKRSMLFSRIVIFAVIPILVAVVIIAYMNLARESTNKADIQPNITFNQSHYFISSTVSGEEPDKFVGDYLGCVSGYFVHKEPGTQPLESDNLYSVKGFSPNFIICAKTSKGWGLFEGSSFKNGAQLYGDTGLNLRNQYVSTSFSRVDANSGQPYKPLKLSESDLQDLFNCMDTQPFVEQEPGLYKNIYRLKMKLNNGTTVTMRIWEHKNMNYIEFYGHRTKLNDSLKQAIFKAVSD